MGLNAKLRETLTVKVSTPPNLTFVETVVRGGKIGKRETTKHL